MSIFAAASSPVVTGIGPGVVPPVADRLRGGRSGAMARADADPARIGG